MNAPYNSHQERTISAALRAAPLADQMSSRWKGHWIRARRCGRLWSKPLSRAPIRYVASTTPAWLGSGTRMITYGEAGSMTALSNALSSSDKSSSLTRSTKRWSLPRWCSLSAT